MSFTPATRNATERPVGKTNNTRRNVVASLIGNSLEWYDFFLYATASAVVFGTLMFPEGTDPLVGTLGAFAGFAVGFAARPIGGIIFGHIGDRVSRKTSLVLTLTLMGIATAAIGVLPTFMQAGILSPLLLVLLRVVQGIAAGGEWGGAVLLISENSRTRRRGLLSAFSQSGVCLGFVLSSLVFYLVQLLPEEKFLSWGWRIPFLISIVLLIVGIWIRRSLPDETAAEEGEKKQVERLPVITAFKRYPRELLVAMGLRVAENGGSYIFLSFSVVYGVHVGVDRGLLLMSVTLSMIVSFFTYLLFGHLSDKIGRRPVYAFGAGAMLLMAFPFFWLLDSNTPGLVVVAFLIANGVCHGAMIGTQPSMFHELFPAHVRYSAMSMAHEIAAVFAGGLAPLIATALLLRFDSSTPIALYLILLCVVTLVAVAFSYRLRSRGVDTTLNRVAGVADEDPE
ncbi:MFS transporter [Leucobacter sp. USHLN153]|uniref:MFS transporter n=1 Tax=Leucobacter sp. USHLN153 TaxID=3081268 RepID=UPI003015E423